MDLKKSFENWILVGGDGLGNLEKMPLLSLAVTHGKTANLIMFLESNERILKDELTQVDTNGNTFFHNICKRIESHSSLVVQKFLEICLEKFENEEEIATLI